jgi:hypothetical protein
MKREEGLNMRLTGNAQEEDWDKDVNDIKDAMQKEATWKKTEEEFWEDKWQTGMRSC